MKSLFAAAATVALLGGAGPVLAQFYQPIDPAPLPQPAFLPGTLPGAPSWMRDDGSSSDYPIHNPGDVSGDWLNAQYQGGLTTAPGTGFPARWDQR